MTTPSDLYSEARAIILDFDGPICSVFAALSPRMASTRMLTALRDGHYRVPNQWRETADPHALLQLVWQHLPDEALHIADNSLTQSEVDAVQGATMTDGLLPLLASVAPRPWAIVSNNSRESIKAYCQMRLPGHSPSANLGRPHAHPGLMKPSPYLLKEALRVVNARCNDAVFIGDSVSDVYAGLAANVPTIRYANKPSKHESLRAAGATYVIDSLSQLIP